jgi:hypothetical protein
MSRRSIEIQVSICKRRIELPPFGEKRWLHVKLDAAILTYDAQRRRFGGPVHPAEHSVRTQIVTRIEYNLQTQIVAGILGPGRVVLEDLMHLSNELVLVPVTVMILADVLDYRESEAKLHTASKYV